MLPEEWQEVRRYPSDFTPLLKKGDAKNERII
jgi:hypothetical protein